MSRRDGCAMCTHACTARAESSCDACALQPRAELLQRVRACACARAAFCVLTEALQRRPLRATLAKARAAAWPCLFAGWRFWPFAHAITYSIIPLHLRVLWVDVLEVIWVAVLSTCVARSGAKAADATADDATVEEGDLELDRASVRRDFVGVVVPTGGTIGASEQAAQRDDGSEEESAKQRQVGGA